MRVTVVTIETNSQVYALSHKDGEVLPIVQSDLDDHKQLDGIMTYDHATLRPIPDKPSKASTAPASLWGDTPTTTKKIYDPYA